MRLTFSRKKINEKKNIENEFLLKHKAGLIYLSEAHTIKQ